MVKADRSGGLTNQELYSNDLNQNQKGGYNDGKLSTEVFGNPNIYVRNDPKYDPIELTNRDKCHLSEESYQGANQEKKNR